MGTLDRFFRCCLMFIFSGGATIYSQIYPVVFSEVLYDSPIFEYEKKAAAVYRNGEYIEFYNPTIFDIDISGWTVEDNNTRFSFPSPTIIYAQKTLVLAYRYPGKPFTLPDLFSSINSIDGTKQIIYQNVIRLNNQGECLRLSNTNGRLVDQMCYGEKYWGLSALNGVLYNVIDESKLKSLHRSAIYSSTQGVAGFAANWETGTPSPCQAPQLADFIVNTPFYDEPITNTPVINTTLPVGSLPGHAAVSPTGAATYQLPIECPPGTNDLQPNVSIVYNSQGRAGVLGPGWDIAGLSAISRTPKNKFYDGENGKTIAFDNTDCLMLDGQRLILLSGTDFSEGAEYGTEFENYTRIYFRNGSFEVRTREGAIMEYGYTPDSKISDFLGGNKIIGWKINRMTDVFGNTMEFKYTDRGEYIDRVEYLGTTDHYINSIQFNYYPRHRNDRKYAAYNKKYCINGFWTNQNKILDNITVYHDNKKVKTYTFNYIQSDIDLRLNTVTAFTPDNSKIAETKINWGRDNNSIQLVSLGQMSDPKVNTSLNTSLYSGDFDGDGYTDKVELWGGSEKNNEDGYIRVVLKNTTLVLVRFGSTTESYPYFKPKLVIGDLNNDGKDEIVLIERTHISVLAYNNGVVENKSRINYTFATSSYNKSYSYDAILTYYNNDEFLDLVILPFIGKFDSYAYSSYFGSVFLGSANDPFEETSILLDDEICHFQSQQVSGDFNADGIVDFMKLSVEKKSNKTYGEKAFVKVVSPAWSEYLFHKPWFVDHIALYNNIIPIDYNSDGLTDLLVQANDNKHNYAKYGWFVLINNGGYDIEPTKIDLPYLHRMYNVNSNEHCMAFPIDYNGDGMVDVVLADETFKNGQFTHTTWYFYKNVNGRFVADGVQTIRERLSRMNPIAMDINSDGVQDLVFGSGSNYRAFTVPDASSRYRVASISNNMGQSDSFSYSTITYGLAESDVADIMHVNKPLILVTAHTDKGSTTTTYDYGRPKTHLKGKGFLGFETVNATNTRTGLRTQSTYGVNTSYYGPELKRQEVFASNTLLSCSMLENQIVDGNSSVNPIAKGKTGINRFMPYVSSSTSTDYLNGTSKTISNVEFDVYWNVTKQVESMGDATKITETTYVKRNGQGVAYLPETIKITQQRTGVPDIVHQTNYTDYNGAGQAGKVIVYPNTDGQLITEYTYYPQGKVKEKKITPARLQSQTTTYDYDAYYRLCTSVTSPLGLTESTMYDFATGNVTKKTNIYGFETEYNYDKFGRLKNELLPTGEIINHTWEWTTSNDAIYKQTVAGTHNKSATSTYFDQYGREVYTEQTGWKGRKLTSSKVYNSRGQLAKSTLPHYDDEVELYTEYVYDDILGRVTGEHVFDGQQTLTTVYAYSRGKTTITPPDAAQKKTETRDKHGLVVERTDAGGTISYAYNAAGQPLTITSNGSKTEIEYDAYGNQKLLKDPNAGNISFTYYAGGLLETQTNAKGDVTVMLYDKYGRIDTKTITENGSNKITTTKHNYVPSGNGVGQIKSIGLYEQGVLKHLQEYGYNNKHQLTSVTDSYDGQTVTFSNTYDDLWRPLTSTSPSGFTTINRYNDYGDLEKILLGNTVIWQGNEQNSKGQFTNYTLGNGLVTKRTFSDRGELESILTSFPDSPINIQNNSYTYYPQTGNLHTRADLKNNRSELFEYDVLDRLTQAYLNNELSHEMVYYSNGNIATKSDVGTYRYDTPRPHAISGIDNVGAGVTNQKQFIEYTAFNKVSHIRQGVDEQTINRVYDIFYGMDEQRIKTVYNDVNISGRVKTRYYFGTYEKETDEFGNVTETDYLYTPAGLTAMQRKTSSGAGLYYIHTDLLGSIERVTNATGQLVSEYTYTPWGGRVLLSGVNITDRGYTGHEHLTPFGDDSNSGFCLINMNGRIYDPVLARFLSPDPYVQAPDFTQSFNRYAYCWNNPLVYTDPSGEFIFTALLTPIGLTALGVIVDGACWGAVIGGATYTISAAFSQGGLNNWNLKDFGNSMLVGAASGAVFAGMGLIAPSFTVSSTSFASNLPTYLGKAGYAALTGGLSAGAGMLTGDYLDDSKINTPFKDYMKGMGIAAATSGLISFGGSVYDYATWDKYTPAQKVARLQQEFGIRIQHDATNTTDYGYFDPQTSQSKLFITDKGLQSRSMARSTIAHELQHYNDFQNYVVAPIRAGNTPSMTGNAYSNFTERNAYSLELRMANKYALSMNDWMVSAAGAKYYGAALSSYYNFNLLMLLRNIY